jgi:copper chaperone CopZ
MEKKIYVSGMKCDGCASNITKSINKIKGVKVKSVDLADKSLLVETKNDLNEVVLRDAIDNGKYAFVGME